MANTSSTVRKHSRPESDMAHPQDEGCESSTLIRNDETSGLTSQLHHVPFPSGPMDKAEEIVVTAIRASDVALGLQRLPAGFYIVLRHNDLEWRTENKPSLVNNDVAEWSDQIPMPSDLSAIVHLEVYASVEFQPMLGAGEQLRRLTTTVGQLLDRSAQDAPFTFFPGVIDVVSPCSSILVVVERRKHDNSKPSESSACGPYWSTPEPRGELEDATNHGHSALSCYRRHGRKRDLERSIQQFERALVICPRDHPCRAAAQSNLGRAKLILSQVEGTDVSLEVALRLHRDALAARPIGHSDRPLTLIQLASVYLARLRRRRDPVDETDAENAEGLLREAMEISATESYEQRAAIVMLQLCTRHGGRAESEGHSSIEQDSTPSVTEEDPLVLSAWLLKQFERFGDLADLRQAITILEGLVRSTSIWDSGYCVALGNLGTALLYRFERLAQLSDLEDSISKKREAVRLIPHGHPDKPRHLNNLCSSFQARFKRFGQLGDLGEAISIQRKAISLCPDGRPDKPGYLNNLGNSFRTRFERLGQLTDLEVAISTLREAVSLTPNSHPDKPMYLSNLGSSFRTRFKHLGDLGDLEDAILSHKNAVGLIPDNHPDKPGYLNNLGNSFRTRFERLGELGDLEDAISTLRDAIGFTPDSHPYKPMRLNNFGNSLQIRFERLGQLNDLRDAILAHRGAVDLTPNDHADKPRYLSSLSGSFLIRFERLGQLGDLEYAISTLSDVVDLTPNGHPEKARCLNGLGCFFLTRFERLGQLTDLEDAISTLREAVYLTPDGHPDKPKCLSNLGCSLQTRFEHFGQLADLEGAISRKRDAVGLTPHDHPRKPGYLNNLGNFFRTRFERLGELSDIKDSTLALRNAVGLTPDGHPDKPGYLNNLGHSFQTRFERLGEPNDLEDAISTFKDAVRLTPDRHPPKSIRLNNLGNSLRLRFERLGQLSDLEDAISTLRDAVELTPFDHPHKPVRLNNLARSLTARSVRLGHVGDLKHALTISSHVASIPIGPARVRLSAAEHWIQCARQIRHSSLLHAYSVAIGLLPQLAWIGLPLSHRYAELTRSAGLVREAAAAALDAGFPETAVEWLEQGRSIVWGELFQLRSSYEELSSAHPNYASRLHALSTQLDQASAAHEQSLSEQNQNGAHLTPESLQQVADKHRALAIERDQLLQEIRRLPGFKRFLLRKPFSQLRAAAHSGPVVILNVAETRCDALIIVANVDHVIHVPLPNFTSKGCANLQATLNGFVRHTRIAKIAPRVGISWDHILSPLWKCVVKPVLDALAFSIVPEGLSRIFWCPTGPLAFLPIHAAGFYEGQYSEPGHKIFDFVVSSYVPTLSTLLGSSSPNVDPPDSVLHLLLVPQPPSDGQAKLPGVAVELGRINDVIRDSPFACTTSEPSDGTVEEVLDLMKQADWVHFACHGIQNGVDSGLCLANRRCLKLRDIVAVSRPHGGLAFLSACQTAMGDRRLSDEAIHVAAGMLFAGYCGVVGTMWSISDWIAPIVARDVYRELLGKGPRPDYREAARALHEAIQDLRRRGVPFDEWIPFIHVGL